MKRMNYILLLLCLFCFGTSVSAQTVRLGEQLTEIPTDGKTQVFLQTATDRNSFWDGDISNPQGDVTDDCVALLVPTGKTVDGNPTYYIQQVSTGKYVLDHPRTDESEVITFTVGTTENISEALAVTILPADANGSYRSHATTSKQSIDGAFVICAADVYKSGGTTYQTYLGWYSGQPFMSSYWDTNAWYFYTVEQAAATEIVEKAISIYFPNGIDESTFPVGSNPGYYTQEAYDAALAVFNKAQDALTSEKDVTYDEAVALLNELKAASEALNASIKPITDGYYFFMGAGRDKTPGIFAMYDNGGNLRWNTTAYKIPETLTTSDAKYIFHVTASNDTVYIRNLATDLYPQSVATSTQVKTAADSIPYTYARATNGMLASFVFRPADDTNTYHYLHEASGGTIVGWSASTASTFQVQPVDITQIDALVAALTQSKLNTALENLVTTANSKIKSTTAYKATVDNLTPEGYVLFDDMGLAPTADNLYCNYPESSEGQYVSYMVDNNRTTYLHTNWSSNSACTALHYIQANLEEAVQTVAFQFMKRTAAANNHLSTFRLLATNDTTAAGTWSDLGLYDVTYDKTTVIGGDTVANSAAIVGATMDQPYKYVRIVIVASTNCSYTYPISHFAEFRVYPAEVDNDNSMIGQVDPSILSALQSQIVAANAVVEAGNATQADIDALQAAYDAFLAQIPDPTKVTDALSSLKTATNGAFYSEDEEVGSFPAEAQTTAQAVIDEMQALLGSKPNSEWTLSDVNEAVSKLEAAQEAFDANMVLPVEGQLYEIRTATTGTLYGRAANAPLYMKNSALESALYYMAPNVSGGDSVEVATHYNYVWLAESVDKVNRTVTLRNLYTGRYLGQQSATSSSIPQSVEPVALPLVPSRANSLAAVNILVYNVEDSIRYLNTGSYGSMVAWTGGQDGASNSAFTFKTIDLSEGEGLTYVPVTPGVKQIITLPVAVEIFTGLGTAYTSTGIDATSEELVTLEEIKLGDDEVVAPGEPFVYEAAEDETELPIYITIDDNCIPTWGFETKYVNGLIGTLEGTSIADNVITAGAWIYDEGILTQLTEESSAGTKKIAANGGYISATNATGVKTVQTVVDSNAAIGKVYDLQGRRVAKAQKGLYIVNGKKVIVK